MTISEKIKHALDIDGVAILPPMDVFESIAILKKLIYVSIVLCLTPGTIKDLAENCLRVNMTTLSQDY